MWDYYLVHNLFFRPNKDICQENSQQFSFWKDIPLGNSSILWKYLQRQPQALSFKLQPVLLSSLAERPQTCSVISQHKREWQSLQLRLPSGAVWWWIVKLNRLLCNDVRNVDKTTFLSRCIDLGQICSISNYKSWWNSELFWYFWDLRSCKGDLKLWCIVGKVVLSMFLSILQLKRKSLQLPDGLLTKVYKDIVNGYHNENCWPNIDAGSMSPKICYHEPSLHLNMEVV